jgi:Fic family protein
MQAFGRYELDEHMRACYRPPIPRLSDIGDVSGALVRARLAVSDFDQALRRCPVPGIVGSLFARLDAVHSSGAEGATTTFTDLLEYQSGRHRAPDPVDAESVSACAIAFDDLSRQAIVPRDAILQIHRRLFEGAPDPHAVTLPGRFKTYPNATFDPDLGRHFYYTQPASVEIAIREWSDFTLETDEADELIRQAASHWMFEHIHPVADGNGRVGRLLVPMLLKAKGLTKTPCAFLGEAVHLEKTVYVQALKDGRIRGDLTGWVRVFLALVAQTAIWNLRRLEELNEVHARWLDRTKAIRADSAVHKLVPWALSHPKFTVTDAAAAIGRTFPAANTAVQHLIKLGLLVSGTNTGRDRLFTAPEVIEIFEPNIATAR